MRSRERIIVILHGAMQRRRLKAVIFTAVLLMATTLTPPMTFAIGRWRRATPRPQQPDLVVERVWTEPVALVTGQPIRIVSQVSNRGQQATPGGVKIRVGYALDGQLATWGEINGPLAAGASVEIPHAGPGATAGAVGAHEIVAIVDVTGLIGESNERNNQRLIQVAVTPPPSAPPPPPPPPSQPLPPPPTSVDLDANRLAALQQLDRRFRIASEDPGTRRPNLRLRYDYHESYYQDKVAAIFGLIEMGQAPRGRLAEANKLLRYQMFSRRFRPQHAGHLQGDSGRFMHRSRSLGMRLYLLFSKFMDDDIKDEYRQRFQWMARDPFVRSSENIKLTNNSSYLLSHEILHRRGQASYRAVKAFLIRYLKLHGRYGTHEWGGHYSTLTFLAILNLAEFSRDREIQKLATMVVDQYLARQVTMSVNGSFASTAVRRYYFWTVNDFVPAQTQLNRLLFLQSGATDDRIFADFVVSNYRPLTAHAVVFSTTTPAAAPYEAGFTDAVGGTHGKVWRHHFYKGNRYAIATHITPEPGYYQLPTGGTHDIITCFIQSAKHPKNKVVPYGYTPGRSPKKKRGMAERSFAYKNVALVNNAGTFRAVWASGGRVTNVPTRLFYYKDFRRELQGGWAFLSDGQMFVAWAPTRGDPVDDNSLTSISRPDRHGRWLKSTHSPGDEGETVVIEVGDAALFGTFAAFKREILSRNSRPRMRSGVVSYRTRDGAELEFGVNVARINGRRYDLATHPRIDGPAVNDMSIRAPGNTIRFDFNAGRTTGRLRRLPQRHVFGR